MINSLQKFLIKNLTPKVLWHCIIKMSNKTQIVYSFDVCVSVCRTDGFRAVEHCFVKCG